MAQFPEIQKSIQNYLYEEEGNITRNKLLMVGSLAVVMSVLFAMDASAAHGSHSSHSSHSFHSSHSSSSHASHTSHQSHTSSTTHSSSGVLYPNVPTPQQTYDTPALPLVPQPAVSAPPVSSAAMSNGIAAAIAMDETTGNMG